MADDLYLTDRILDADTYIDDETRLHLNGTSMELQVKVGDTWVVQQTWGA